MTMKNKIITGITATAILASVGISAIPQEKFYKDIPLPIETSQEYQTRKSYNSVTIPTKADLALSESWLLGDKTLNLEPTEFEGTFYGAWINYMENGEWKDIDSDFRKTDKGFVMDNAPFEVVAPLTSTGVVTFLNNNTYDIVNDKTFDEPILTQTIQAMCVAEVVGELETGDLGWGEATYVVYHQAYPDYDADLIYFVHEGTAPRLKKLVRFNSLEKAPSVDTEFDFKISYDNLVYIQRKIGDRFVGWTRKSPILNYQGVFNVKVTGSKFVNDDSKIRGNAMKAFKIWDLGDKSELINVNLSYLEDETFVLTKIIPSDFFADAQFPVYTDTTTDFYPDEDPESTSVDGYAGWYASGGYDWATIRGQAGNQSSESDFGMSVYMGSHTSTNEWSYLRRLIILFDTSAIPDTDIVSAATLNLYVYAKEDALGVTPVACLVSSNPASNTGINDDDYDLNNFGTTRYATDMTYASVSTSAYNTFTLNTDGKSAVSKTSISKFGVMWAADRDNSAPSWTSSEITQIECYQADHGTNKPKLTVTYAPAAVRNRLIIIQ